MTLVVRHEAVERPEVDGRNDVDRVKGSERGLRQSARGLQQCAVERQQPERIDEFTAAVQEDGQRQPGIVGDRPRIAREISVSASSHASLLTGPSVAIGLALGPIMIAGSFTGKRIVDRLPEQVFVIIIEGVLIVAGLVFLIGG